MSKAQTLDQSTLNCVRENLAEAAVNGHNFEGYTDAEVAGDVIAYDDTFAGWTVEDLTPYITAVRESLGTNGTIQ